MQLLHNQTDPSLTSLPNHLMPCLTPSQKSLFVSFCNLVFEKILLLIFGALVSLPAPVFATSWCSAGDDTIYLTAPNPTFNLSPIQSACFMCTIRTFFIAFLMQFFLHRHVPLQRYNSSRLLDPFAPFFPTWTVSAAFLCVCFDFASASSNLPQESVQHSFLTSLSP